MSNVQAVMSANEAAMRLGCSANTIIRRIRAGEIKTVGKLPGSRGAFLIDEETVNALIRERAEELQDQAAALAAATGGKAPALAEEVA